MAFFEDFYMLRAPASPTCSRPALSGGFAARKAKSSQGSLMAMGEIPLARLYIR